MSDMPIKELVFAAILLFGLVFVGGYKRVSIENTTLRVIKTGNSYGVRVIKEENGRQRESPIFIFEIGKEIYRTRVRAINESEGEVVYETDTGEVRQRFIITGDTITYTDLD